MYYCKMRHLASVLVIITLPNRFTNSIQLFSVPYWLYASRSQHGGSDIMDLGTLWNTGLMSMLDAYCARVKNSSLSIIAHREVPKHVLSDWLWGKIIGQVWDYSVFPRLWKQPKVYILCYQCTRCELLLKSWPKLHPPTQSRPLTQWTYLQQTCWSRGNYSNKHGATMCWLQS